MSQTSRFSTRGVAVLATIAALAMTIMGLATVFDASAPDPSRDGSALSRTAVGLGGAVALLKARGVAVDLLRDPPSPQQPRKDLLVLTPTGFSAKSLTPFHGVGRQLIVAPKWVVEPQPWRMGRVRKQDATSGDRSEAFDHYAAETIFDTRKDRAPVRLRGVDGPFRGRFIGVTGPIDRLRTVSGRGWIPAVVDERGRAVVVYSQARPDVMLLSEPDLLNTQGIADIGTARAGMNILDGARGDQGVAFDLTLSGHGGDGGLNFVRVLLTPPWLAVALSAAAAILLLALNALSRFGFVHRAPRAIALGARALIDNSAALARMTGREREFAPDYADLTGRLAYRTTGGPRGAGKEDRTAALAAMARRKGLEAPQALAAEASRVKTPADLTAYGRKLYDWRQEITGGR